MSGFSDADLTRNAFLGGKLKLWQPVRGYRAGTDPVLLAAGVPAKPGQSVLEIGCGAGTAILCLAHRVRGIEATGLELQADYAELARRNAQENELPLEVVVGSLGVMPDEIKSRNFDHVLMNPPFFGEGSISAPKDGGRQTAHVEGSQTLKNWVDAGLRRLRQGGYLTIIHRAERLGELLVASHGRADGGAILPIAAREGRAAGRVIVQLRKGSNSDICLLPPLVMHRGTRHEADREDYTEDAQSILRGGHAIDTLIG